MPQTIEIALTGQLICLELYPILPHNRPLLRTLEEVFYDVDDELTRTLREQVEDFGTEVIDIRFFEEKNVTWSAKNLTAEEALICDGERYGQVIRSLWNHHSQNVAGEDVSTFIKAATEQIISENYPGIQHFILATRKYRKAGLCFQILLADNEDFNPDKLQFICEKDWADGQSGYPIGLQNLLKDADCLAEAVIYDGKIYAAEKGSDWSGEILEDNYSSVSPVLRECYCD